jgi:multiple sugar transport system substrate-binding protein
LESNDEGVSMKFRKLAAVAAVAGLALGGLAACSSGSGDSNKGVTLTYWASNQGTSLANDKAVLTPVLNKFTKQTGIKVKLEVIGWDSLQTRINTAVSSGVGPDVVNIGNTWAPYLDATGAFLPYDDANMKAIGGADKFVKTALQTGGLANQTPTSVPLYGLAYGLYYNKKMFSDAGLQPPTTWEDMVADAKKLTNPAADQWGMSLQAGSYTENVHFAFITAEQNGATLFDGQKPNFTDSKVVDGVQRYLDLMQTDKVVNPADAQYTDGTGPAADFAKGRAAMIVNQDNAGPQLEADGMSTSDYGVVAIPAPQGGKQISSGIQGINLSVFKNTKHKDQALQFVKYMTSASTQGVLGKPYASIPVLKGVTPTFTDNADIAKVFSDVYNNHSAPYPLVPLEGAFETNVGNAINGLFANIATNGSVSQSDIKSAMQTAQDKTNAAG